MSQPSLHSQIERARQLVEHGELTTAEKILAHAEKCLDEGAEYHETMVDILNEERSQS